MQNLLALVLPMIVDVVIDEKWNSTVKQWVSIAICVVVGVLLNLNEFNSANILDNGNFLVTVGLVVASAQGTYFKYWKDSSIRAKVFKDTTQPVAQLAVDEVPAIQTVPAQ